MACLGRSSLEDKLNTTSTKSLNLLVYWNTTKSGFNETILHTSFYTDPEFKLWPKRYVTSL